MTLTTEGYCDKHKADLNPKRDSSSARLYGHKWRKESKLYLASHSYCAECERQGRHTLATEVDHIKPHKGNLKLFWDRNNWQGLCHADLFEKTGVNWLESKTPNYDIALETVRNKVFLSFYGNRDDLKNPEHLERFIAAKTFSLQYSAEAVKARRSSDGA